MELDPARRDSPLAMLVVEETDPGDGCGAGQVREARARLSAADAVEGRTCATDPATGDGSVRAPDRRELGDHRPAARRTGHHEMHVAVRLDLGGDEPRLDLESRPLDTAAAELRQVQRGALANQCVDRRAARAEVDPTCGGIGHRLDRPALHAAQAGRDIERVDSRRRRRRRCDPSCDGRYRGHDEDECDAWLRHAPPKIALQSTTVNSLLAPGDVESTRASAGLKTILNILWLVLAGIWLALGYLIAAVLMAITIIGIPFAKQAVKLAGYALWPFGRTLVQSATRHKGISVVGNVLWFVLAGWWLALEHLILGALLCLTIIGIPLGVGSFKMAAAALVPFGRQVVRLDELAQAPTDSIAIGD
jgi:uncharacterized membrane protein YccF (DUF307 family)